MVMLLDTGLGTVTLEMLVRVPAVAGLEWMPAAAKHSSTNSRNLNQPLIAFPRFVEAALALEDRGHAISLPKVWTRI